MKKALNLDKKGSYPARLTRGTGLLEPLLARLRVRQANRLIPDNLRSGRILDIGCGSYPYFLSHVAFKEKFAIDQVLPVNGIANINWFSLDLNSETNLPFKDGFFNIVTPVSYTHLTLPTTPYV